ncbi:MAG: glucose/galactose MFS transporter, partial [Kangiellaceae bacterium]|nr:glucose/galactose MFS transporter [Kangiellaceae bacterium]
LSLAVALFLLALVFAFLRLPAVEEHQDQQNTGSTKSVLQHKHLFLGAVGIFVYVGAEVGIGSFLVSFLSMPSIGAMHESEASKYIGYYFGGAMIGRFIGAVIMHHIAANKVLTFNALMAITLLLIGILAKGHIAMWAIVLVGLCNSIMFPTIFTLAIKKLGPLTSKGAGVLCLAIVGGAILPLLQGVAADLIGIQLAFIIPVLCYFYIAFYGFKGYQVSADTNQGNV